MHSCWDPWCSVLRRGAVAFPRSHLYTSLPTHVTSRIPTLNKACESELEHNKEPCFLGSNGLRLSCPDSLKSFCGLVFYVIMHDFKPPPL